MIVFEPPIELPYVPARIAWLTGLSDPRRCGLSESQERFLRRIEAPEDWKVYRNFPYLPCENGIALPGILRASLRNGRQFAAAAGWKSSSAARYRRSIVGHWRALANSTDRLLLIAGSCGLQIAEICRKAVAACRAETRIAALGPVGLARPDCDCLLVQGTRDYVSRLFFRRPDLRIPGAGHLDYAANEQVFDVVNRWICSSISN